ncbi:hypothetical protein [Rhizobium leguminosarum]|uniref:hypothetical protein n=1 Tax=Rhizobium leguminosarum TaxID=384 RepID=UPI003ECF5399
MAVFFRHRHSSPDWLRTGIQPHHPELMGDDADSGMNDAAAPAAGGNDACLARTDPIERTTATSESERLRRALVQFQQKCVAVLRPELRENKEIEHFRDSEKTEML